MTKAKTITGARCKLYINGQLAGVFNQVSYGVQYGTADIYVLGRFNAGEIVYTDMSTVDVQVSGFRVLENGPFEIGSVPQLQELLNHEDIHLTLTDRQNADKEFMTVTGVRPTGFNGSTSARSVHDLSVNFKGTLFSDESGDQDDVGATNFG